MHFLRLLSAVALSTPLALMAAPPTFTQSAIGDNLPDAFDVVAGDFNGDSFQDIVVTLPFVADIFLLANPGGDLSGEWARTEIDVGSRGAAGVEAGDIDLDGDLDVIVAASADNDILWFENPQTGDNTTWIKHEIALNSTLVFFVEPADFDGDGDIDVVASVQGEDSVTWYMNPGAGTVKDVSSWDRFDIDTAATEVSGLRIADIDEDGDPDVVANAGGRGDILWYQNPGGELASGDWEKNEIEITNNNNAYSVVGDFDGDGNLDVGAVARNRVFMYFSDSETPGDGWEEVELALDLGLLSGVSRIDAADFDADGDLDIVVSSTATDDVVYFENPGSSAARDEDNWTFESIAEEPDPNEPIGIAVADFDNNGVSDFAVALGDANEVRLFLNQTVVVPLMAPVISAFEATDGGGFEITFDVVAGVKYTLQSSGDLSEFTDVEGVTVDDSGVIPIPAGDGRMFYRITADR